MLTMRGHEGNFWVDGNALHFIWLVVQQYRHTSIKTRYTYTIHFLVCKSYFTSNRKEWKGNSSSYNFPPPLRAPRMSSHLPTSAFFLLHPWKTEFLVLSRLGYCSLEVPASAIRFVFFFFFFQFPLPFFKIIFKKQNPLMKYSTLLWKSSRPGPAGSNSLSPTGQ